MRFTVNTLRAAERDRDKILNYLAERSKAGATAWAKAFDRALARLEKTADAYPLAVEDEHIEFEVREILFKTRRGLVYRILFTIRETTALILHIRGPAQDFVDAVDLREPE